jgi:ribosomal protein S18 acetylase RimI-like enzyme
MSDMQFRSAVPADAAEIAAFMTRNFLATYGHSSSPENIQQAVHDYYGIDAQYADLANENIINCLCIMDNKIAGLAQVKPPKTETDLQHFELSRFYVDVPYHGKGIAPALMQETLTQLREKSATQVWLSVWQEARQAIRFYQKQGFVISGDIVFMIGADPMKDWLMTKQL